MKWRRNKTAKKLLAAAGQQEDTARLAMAEIQSQAQASLERIEDLKRELTRKNHAARDALLAGQGSTVAHVYGRRVQALAEMIEREKARLVQLHHSLHHKCQELADRRKARKAVQTVTDRHEARDAARERTAAARDSDDAHRAHASWQSDRAGTTTENAE